MPVNRLMAANSIDVLGTASLCCAASTTSSSEPGAAGSGWAPEGATSEVGASPPLSSARSPRTNSGTWGSSSARTSSKNCPWSCNCRALLRISGVPAKTSRRCSGVSSFKANSTSSESLHKRFSRAIPGKSDLPWLKRNRACALATKSPGRAPTAGIGAEAAATGGLPPLAPLAATGAAAGATGAAAGVPPPPPLAGAPAKTSRSLPCSTSSLESCSKE
mmetsp:Transcript_56381/g.183161  ORF Transcript_56381/g.183161 Transcript_56381/m.183161 type:complete len:219 (+) Transcript_56381:884-1540(+)